MANKTRNYREIKIEVQGKEVVGRYYVEDGVVFVELWKGEVIRKKPALIGSSTAEAVARLLLRELSEE